VTPAGLERLTLAPREINEIEGIMKEKRKK
jgi:hypothetical protein